MRVYDEPVKLSDILGANLVPLPTRTVVVDGSQNYMLGSIMVAPAGQNAVFELMDSTNLNSAQCGILGEYAIKPRDLAPTDDFTATLYFGGSFQEKKLLVANEANPVNVLERREYLLARNIYLESGNAT
jgi:hypothetical protein